MAKPSRFDWFFRPHMPDEDRPLSAELRFAEALAELPAIERSALALSEIGGLGTDEIAQRLGTDVAVVRKVLARARQTVRTTIAVRGRRGLSALVPFQSWWSSGSVGPAVRTAGAVAAAVIGTGVAIGGAAADPPRPPLVSPDPPAVRALDKPQDRPGAAVVAASGVGAVLAERARAPESASGPAAVRPGAHDYGDIGARPAEPATTRPPSAPARRADEPEIGARPAPPSAAEPAPPATPLPEAPAPGPSPAAPPPPPLPFPTPYPVPVPVPTPAPAPLPVPIPAPAPTSVPAPVPVPLPPIESPVETPTPSLPAPPPLP